MVVEEAWKLKIPDPLYIFYVIVLHLLEQSNSRLPEELRTLLHTIHSTGGISKHKETSLVILLIKSAVNNPSGSFVANPKRYEHET